MKTRDLIARLAAADPTGDAECVVDGDDIYTVEALPVYHDGTPAILVHDAEARDKSWSIVGLRYPAAHERKVVMRSVTAHEAIEEDPGIPVAYGDDRAWRMHAHHVDRMREIARSGR